MARYALRTRPPMKYAQLVKAINSVTSQLQGRAAAAVNQALVLRNWLVGAYIVEYEQAGKDRAKYGARLLEALARDIKGKGITGLYERMLRNCRLAYLVYPQIRLSLTAEFESGLPAFLPTAPIRLSPTAESETTDDRPAHESPLTVLNSADSVCRIPAQVLPESTIPIRGSVTRELPAPLEPAVVLRFSWTKLVELIAIADPWKRAFYENECLKGNWSVRQLQRQIGSLLYERTGLSTNKKAVIERARRQEPAEQIADLIRDPYVLEFTGLAALPEYTESELERALLDHLQNFLLELGGGFCFEARQKRITVGRKHNFIDLVFYHRLLRCHVLIDLKVRPFNHGDAGQMNFYLNWWKENVTASGENPTVGIILCSDREKTEVEYATAGMDNKLFVSRYLVALPSVEQLREFVERDRDRTEALIEQQRKRPAAKTARRNARRAS
jgi:predicted nuclease of restriction endonuclease-like (RecB) superfamily